MLSGCQTKEAFQKIRGIVGDAAKRALSALFSRFPINKNLVVFDNFNGRGYGCNPKYIAEELADSGLILVWLAKNPNEGFPKYIRPVKYNSIGMFRVLATAHVRINNVRSYKGVPKREGQFCIQTWHAMVPFKKVEKRAESYLTERYIREAKLDGSTTDLMIANNEVDEREYKESFWYSGPVLRLGLPRLGPLLHPDEALAKRVRSSIGIPNEVGVVLYAPTFRDYNPSFVPQFDYDKVLAALNCRFGREFVCLNRLHPNASANASISNGKTLFDVNNWPDTQELLLITDVVITDYSTVAMDFSITGKPVFLFTPDIIEYETKSREFFLSPLDCPFPLSKDLDALLNEISHYDEIVAGKKYEAFFKEIGLRDDGYGARDVAEIVVDICKSNLSLPDLESTVLNHATCWKAPEQNARLKTCESGCQYDVVQNSNVF